MARTDRFHSTWTGTHSFSPPSQLSKAETVPDCHSRQQRTPSLTYSQLESFLPGKGRTSAFIILSPAAYYWDQVSDEYGPEMGAPFCPAPTREWRLYLKCGVAGDPGAWSPWPTSISIVIWSHEGLRVLPYTVEGHGVSHMEMLGISPTLSFRALRFCLGDKHAIKPMAPDVPSK